MGTSTHALLLAEGTANSTYLVTYLPCLAYRVRSRYVALGTEKVLPPCTPVPSPSLAACRLHLV